MTNKYEVCSVDIWGNEQDGYDLNDVFATGKVVSLRDDMEFVDVKKALAKHGYKLDGRKHCLDERHDIGDFYILAVTDHKPLLLLRQLDDEQE